MVTRKSFEPKKVLLPRRLCPAIPNPILPTGSDCDCSSWSRVHGRGKLRVVPEERGHKIIPRSTNMDRLRCLHLRNLREHVHSRSCVCSWPGSRSNTGWVLMVGVCLERTGPSVYPALSFCGNGWKDELTHPWWPEGESLIAFLSFKCHFNLQRNFSFHLSPIRHLPL